MKLVTATGFELNYKYDEGINHIVAEYDSMSDAAADAEQLTEEALTTVEFVDDNGNVMGTYHNLVLVSTEIIPDEDIFICHINLREKSKLEKDVQTLQEEMIEVQEALVEG